MREKGKGGIFKDGIKVAALPIVKHMPAGLTMWLKKKDGSESSSCTYGRITSGLCIVVEATRLDWIRLKVKTGTLVSVL